MLRSHRRLLWALRRTFSTEIDKPKRVTHFDKKKYEIFMQDILDRESPMLQLSEEKALRPPFLEQVFQKKFDERFLTFPEVLDNARVDDIHALYERVRSYVDTLAPDCMEKGPPVEVMQKLKSLDVFRILLPYSDGGLDLTMTEMARVMEAFATLPSLALIVATHNVAGVRTIARFAPEAYRKKYLPLLTAGKTIVAFAMDEDAFVESRTKATVDGDECIISGKKIFVKNAKSSEVFVLICDCQMDGESGQATILVERNLEGVLVEDSPRTYGLKGCGLSTVHFRNVRVPRDCVLGGTSERSKLAENIAANVRVALSAAAIGPCREAFEQAFRHTFSNERFKQLLCSFQLIQEQITLMALDVFTMESCVYFSLAIEDVVQDPNLRMESIATAITCLEASDRVLNRSADIFGARGKYLNHTSTRWLDEIVTSPFFFASPREHSVALAQIGLRAVAKNTADNAGRSQALVPSFAGLGFPIQQIVSRMRKKDSPEKHGQLYQFLHPSLMKSADILDYVQRNFGSVCERLVRKYGDDAIHNRIVLDHISRITLDIFALSQTLSRSSRSYCIGHFNGYEEIKMASVHSRMVLPRFESRMEALEKIIERGTLPERTSLASSIFASKQYFVPHPVRKLGPSE